MFRLDYISCVLTIVSTLMVGRRMWYGWLVAGVNSVVICAIGWQTRQFGFVPANLFCLALYVSNIYRWRKVDTGRPAQSHPGVIAPKHPFIPLPRPRNRRRTHRLSRSRKHARNFVS